MRKIYLGIIVALLFLSQPVMAGDYKWDLLNAVIRSNFQTIEEIIKNNVNQMSVPEKRLVYSFVLDYNHGDNTTAILGILLKYNIHAAAYDLYNAINKSHADNVVQFILDDGAVPNGEILLLAVEKGRFNFAKTFIETGVDVNYRYPPESSFADGNSADGNPADGSSADGMTALLHASKWGNFELVKLLVDHGADVNMRSKNGSTALSIAYEKGQADLYNYLKDHGAADVTLMPPVSGGIAAVLNNEPVSLSHGTYRLSGGSLEIKIAGDSRSGTVMYTNRQGRIVNGIFRIEGNAMTIILDGLNFMYQINSAASFSGNGETWIRIGD
ncbi:MAG: ankyrin repeat domain-containing protein [Treponema sp.]|jgi:hypothetical protein|nr:ankyrin repeat domain-containing protein [Treponema sp.]